MSRTIFAQAAQTLKDAALETLWPTRCAICDAPGALICSKCRISLPYIDQLLACPRCGAPYGVKQCTECNGTMLSAHGLERLPFESCCSVLHFDDRSKSIITTYKDLGEQRLSKEIATMMASHASPEWAASIQAITYVPASIKAVRRRGFDHGALIANDLGALLNKPVINCLQRPKAADQRTLGRKDRSANMQKAFQGEALTSKSPPSQVLLIDDVMTTGATMIAASQALKEKGIETIRCLSFARV